LSLITTVGIGFRTNQYCVSSLPRYSVDWRVRFNSNSRN
jgi:hypothetical protein